MKVSRLSTIALGGSLLLAAGAMAGNGNTNKKSIHLYENATIEGTPLAPGDYKVEWRLNPAPSFEFESRMMPAMSYHDGFKIK